MTTTPASSSVWLRRFGGVAIAASLVAASALVTRPADAQSVADLRSRAKAVAAELSTLDQKTSDLDEQYNSANLELAGLNDKLKANEGDVASAKSALNANRSQAQAVAVQAFVGTNDHSGIIGVDDVTTDSRRRAYLSTRYSDSQQVIDTLVASQKDLADREASLAAARAKVDAKVADVKNSSDQLRKLVADRKSLYDSVSGDLAAAVQAEQDRAAAAAAAKAQREAEQAAARAQTARRTQVPAISLVSRGGGARLTAAVEPAAPVAPALTPPPADAPVAVQVAMAQRGKPYVWAASGPNSFDCSGLILFAYRSAGDDPVDLVERTAAGRPRVRRLAGAPRRAVHRKRPDGSRPAHRNRGAGLAGVLHRRFHLVRSSVVPEVGLRPVVGAPGAHPGGH